mgnify:CR=1 FL=1|tara:strand:+ start:646 stop:1506 length:861 start_codon:yes stop_codon:yes gene_type:complete
MLSEQKVIKSNILNLLGIQVFRYIFSYLYLKLKKTFYRINNLIKLSKSQYKYSLFELDSDGFCEFSISACSHEISNNDLLNEWNEAFKIREDEGIVTNNTIYDSDTIVNRRTFIPKKGSRNIFANTIKIFNSDYVRSILSSYIGKEIKDDYLIDQKIWFDDINNGIEFCSANELHTDIYYSTLKLWIFIEDVKDESSPFAYCKNSHLFSLQRCAFEYRKSKNYKKEDDFSWRVKDDSIGSYLKNETLLTTPAGSVLIADTHGFHARHFSCKKNSRKQIHLSLRYKP